MMRKTHLLPFLCLILLPSGARAQGVQNSDIFWLFGATSAAAQNVGSVAIQSGGSSIALAYGYGYQIVRQSAASLWVEFAPAFGGSNAIAASIPGVVDLSWSVFPLGVRFMIPLASRVSVYAAVGGGIGDFHLPRVVPGTNPSIGSTATWHGVFDFGGGVDLRLNRRFSLRAEIRDYVTGAGLSGVAGRNRLLPSGGVALHF